jgi:hypothetical protein
MSKYTEDDLKLELATKEWVRILYRIRSGYPSYRFERRYCSCHIPEEPQWMTDYVLSPFALGNKWRNREGQCIMQTWFSGYFLLFSSKVDL